MISIFYITALAGETIGRVVGANLAGVRPGIPNTSIVQLALILIGEYFAALQVRQPHAPATLLACELIQVAVQALRQCRVIIEIDLRLERALIVAH